MNARTFGKKGTGDGQAASASRRAAFLAQERARAGESRTADTEVFPAGGGTIVDRIEFVDAKPKRVRAPVGPRSLRLTYILWLLFGLGGVHRLYLGRYASGALQAALFLGCFTVVFGLQYYQAFAGLALSWIWMFADGLRLKKLHAEAVGIPAGTTTIIV